MSNFSDNELNYDDIDFTKNKRGKRKNQANNKHLSLFLIEGLIIVILIGVAGRYLFNDNSEVSHLQATIDAQNQRPVLSADELYRRALSESDGGNTDAAIRDLDLSIDIDPTNPLAYYQRARMHYDRGSYRQSLMDFQSALNTGYDDPHSVYYYMGLDHFELEEYSKAVTDLSSALDLDTEDVRARYWRGRSYAKLDVNEKAVKDIEMAIELGYEDLEYAYFYLAAAYDDLKDYQKSADFYTRSIREIESDCKRYECWVDYNNRGVEYFRMGDYERAIKDYTRSMELNPEPYALALQNRGDAYESLGERSSALADWNTLFTVIKERVITREFLENSNVLSASIDGSGVEVHVQFKGNKGDVVTIISEAHNSSVDTMLIVRDALDNAIAYNDQYHDMNDARIDDLVLPADGTYTIVVAGDLGTSTGDFTLTLER